MKNNKTLMYFIISSITCLFLIGIFIFLSSNTYSSANPSIEAVNNEIIVPYGGTAELNVNVIVPDGSNQYMLAVEPDHIHPSNTLCLTYYANDNTSGNATIVDNSDITLSTGEGEYSFEVQVKEEEYFNNDCGNVYGYTIYVFDASDDFRDPLTSTTILVNIISVNTAPFGANYAIAISNINSRPSLNAPSGYSEYDAYWEVESGNDVIEIQCENGSCQIVPLSNGSAQVHYYAYDDNNNIVAEQTFTVTVADTNPTFNYQFSPVSDIVTVPIGGSTDIGVRVGPLEPSASYSIIWHVSSCANNVSLSTDSQDVNEIGNYANRVTIGNNFDSTCSPVVSASLYKDANREPVATTSITVNVKSVDTSPITNLFAGGNSIDLSSGRTQLIVPEEYSDYDIEWSSSSSDILEIDSDGYATPKATGSVNVTFVARDDNGTIVAMGTVTAEVTDTTGKVDYTLSSLSVTPGTIAPTFDPKHGDYIVNIGNAKEFSITATASNGHGVIISDEENTKYSSGETIQFVGNSMSFTICVTESSLTQECENVYNLIVVHKSESMIKDSYLEFLSIEYEEVSESDFECSNAGSQRVCNYQTSVPSGTNEVYIDASTISGYGFQDGHGPGTYPLSVGDNSVVLNVVNLETGDVEAVYHITITVPSSGGNTGNTGGDYSTGDVSHNPGTSDISSFLIFIIMLGSLVVSLLVYKKNLGNN